MAQTTAAVPATDELRVAMSYEEWLAWPDSESKQTEWIDGEVVVFMPPSGVHQDVIWFLSYLLGWYVQALDLGTFRLAPFEMHLSERESREPDMLFVAREHRDRLTPQRLNGPADLAIEIVSDASVTRDGVEKLEAYRAAGVPEYWLLDPRPRRQTGRCYRLGTGGVYEPILPDGDGRVHSAVLPGFWFRPDWLWQRPSPSPLACMLLIAPDVVATELRAAFPPVPQPAPPDPTPSALPGSRPGWQ